MKTEETQVIATRVSKEVYKKLEEKMQKENRTRSNALETILKEYFKLK